MDKELIIERIQQLSLALVSSNKESKYPNYFTVWERIMIHQEIAYWMNTSRKKPTIVESHVSELLNEKINTLLK